MPKRSKQIDEATTAGATVTQLLPGEKIDFAKPKKGRAKQSELAGIEAPSHPALDLLMEEAATLGETMGAARQRMGEVNAQLEQEAEKLGVTTYRHPTAVPTLTLTVSEGATKVKVKKAKGADDTEVDE